MSHRDGMFVREIGDRGDHVVVLHPGPGLDGSVFLPGAQTLADAGHRVLLVDLPGNGMSADGARDEWTLSGYARAVQRLITTLDADVTLLGHSFGGYVALQHLVDHPGAVSRLITSCTDADEEWPEGLGEPAEPTGAARQAFERESTVETPGECLAIWRDQLPYFSEQPLRVAAMLENVTFRPDVMRHRDWGEFHALDALSSADIPVLAVGAGRDPAFPLALADRIAETAPRGTVLHLSDAGHFPFAEDPERYWGSIANWLAATTR